MKEGLCKAFCNLVNVRTVPCGYAVTMPFAHSDGDPVLLYFVRAGRSWRIEDDGRQVPLLEASGVNVGGGSRGEAFRALLSEYGASFNDDERTLYAGPFSDSDAPVAALKFMALLLRVQDLLLLTPASVRNTFRQDALAAIHSRFEGVAEVTDGGAVSGRLSSLPADVVLSGGGRVPLAVYLGTSDEKALQALVLKMEAEKYSGVACRVVLLVERAKENPLREPTYALAQARLDEVLSFRGVESDAMEAMHRAFQQGAARLQ